MNKDLKEGTIFTIHEKKRLGLMRVDWADGNISNKWKPTNLLIDLKKDSEIDIAKLQQELNYLQFELVSSFQKVEKYCNGNGYNSENIFSISLD
ncbi:hypothetical protein [Clostridium estertheticum]|uniref:Uncharacterized protein n=1 Tax=Clostridium estertheticum subsp. estertheticum TaxID=1552 RepID=A0A1J0GC58_9CLOT|nr:hypothetical protein [Clostridium estertheticum]APC38887.1 hypothetical protein A7L45_01795 [Clostridium estertheticum subsp. estertheticum]MBZ9615167.1 hypothetical protein [Clostridium estertheticum subsp. laramiense]WAG75061.1 hypothetical protein LL032_06310 [Clostridium estertheticum]